jgi:hypothetical protein
MNSNGNFPFGLSPEMGRQGGDKVSNLIRSFMMGGQPSMSQWGGQGGQQQMQPPQMQTQQMQAQQPQMNPIYQQMMQGQQGAQQMGNPMGNGMLGQPQMNNHNYFQQRSRYGLLGG